MEQRFAWPIDFLFHLSAAVVDGTQMAHGDVLRATDELLRGFVSPVEEWLVVQSKAVAAARTGGALGTVPLLVLSRVLTKNRYKGGKDARTEAGKRAKFDDFAPRDGLANLR